MIAGDEETKDYHGQNFAFGSFNTKSPDIHSANSPAEEHYSRRERMHGRPEGNDTDHPPKHRASEAERTQSVPNTLPDTAADTITAAAVGFDIETTGIEDDDILTVACAWSPGVQVTCFHGDDFAPLLSMLDKATLIYTFNGIEFDLPRLAKHCGRSNIGAWARKTIDPHYLMFNAMGFGGCMRLNDLLIANGFEPKSGSGLQAIQFWNEGNRQALSSYCMDDARLTYALCEKRNIMWGNSWRVCLWEPCVMRFSGK